MVPPSKLPIETVWTIFEDRMSRNFTRTLLEGGIEFANNGITHSGMYYATTISPHNTIMVATRWSSGLEVEMTITIHAQGPEAKAYCQTEIDPTNLH